MLEQKEKKRSGYLKPEREYPCPRFGIIMKYPNPNAIKPSTVVGLSNQTRERFTGHASQLPSVSKVTVSRFLAGTHLVLCSSILTDHSQLRLHSSSRKQRATKIRRDLLVADPLQTRVRLLCPQIPESVMSRTHSPSKWSSRLRLWSGDWCVPHSRRRRACQLKRTPLTVW